MDMNTEEIYNYEKKKYKNKKPHPPKRLSTALHNFYILKENYLIFLLVDMYTFIFVFFLCCQ